MSDETVVDRGDELPEEVLEAETPTIDELELSPEEQLELGLAPEEEAPEEEEEEEEEAQGPLIPKTRFDEAVGRERAEKERLASQLAALEKRDADRAVAQDMQKASAQIKTMIKEHTQMLADGELDKASDLMGDILQLQSDMADYRSQAYADQGRSQAKSEIQYDAVVARLEMEYPEINPDNVDGFDSEAVRKVQAYMTGLQTNEKMSPSKALQEAVATILGAKRAMEGQSDDARRRAADELGVRRKEAAVTKGLDANRRQPANLKDVGKDHDREGGVLDAAAVMKLPYAEFEKLSDEKLSQLRGDLVG
jgi:hypothetical protein